MKTDVFVNGFEDWTRSALPKLNTAVETGVLDIADYWQALRPWVIGCWEICRCAHIPREVARRLLMLLSFGVNSTERHYQASHHKPGQGLRKLEWAERALVALAEMSGLPPHGSVYTVWLLNRSLPPLTFTGDPQEEFFHASVLRTDDLNRASCKALRRITTGEELLSSPEAIQSMELATRNARELRRLFQSFMKRDPATGSWPITPEFFALRMRTYLVSYPIDGQLRSGGNAGDLPSQIQLDHILGTKMEDYEHVLARRLPNLTAEDRRLVEEDINRPSLFELFLRLMGPTVLQAEELDLLDTGTIRLSNSDEPAAEAFGRLVKAHGDASAAHWALIVNFLVRIDRHVDQVDVPTPVTKGTGGIDHETTYQIMKARREHPASTWRNK